MELRHDSPMHLRKSIASALGVAFALSCPFINWGPVLGWALSPGPARDIVFPFALVLALGAVSFGINRRSLDFFHIRGVSWRDIGAALLAIPVSFALFMLAGPMIDHFGHSRTASSPGDYADDPLWFGLAAAVAAGVFEEFIFRGFIIEELGELIRSRRVAAAVSVVFFALAHHVSKGWSLELIYPGLLGAVITVLYFSRRNLPICMLLHATFDLLPVLVRRFL